MARSSERACSLGIKRGAIPRASVREPSDPGARLCSLNQVLSFQGIGFVKLAFLCVCGAHMKGTSASFCYCEETPRARQLTEGWVFMAEPMVAREAWLEEQETGRPHLHPSQRAEEVNRKWGESMNPESTSSNDILPPARLRLPALLPRQNNTPNLGPSFQISKPHGDASHSNHHGGQGGTSGVSASVAFSLIASRQKLSVLGAVWPVPLGSYLALLFSARVVVHATMVTCC